VTPIPTPLARHQLVLLECECLQIMMQLEPDCVVPHYQKLLLGVSGLLFDLTAVESKEFDRNTVLERLLDLMGHLLQSACPLEPPRGDDAEHEADDAQPLDASLTTPTTNAALIERSNLLLKSVDFTAILDITNRTASLFSSGIAGGCVTHIRHAVSPSRLDADLSRRCECSQRWHRSCWRSCAASVAIMRSRHSSKCSASWLRVY